MVPTQLEVRPLKRRQSSRGRAQGALRRAEFRLERPRGTPPRAAVPAIESPNRSAPEETTGRARPKKGPGPLDGCFKCRWAGGGCGSCNAENKGKAARRKRARVQGPAGGPQWAGLALREEPLSPHSRHAWSTHSPLVQLRLRGSGSSKVSASLARASSPGFHRRPSCGGAPGCAVGGEPGGPRR